MRAQQYVGLVSHALGVRRIAELLSVNLATGLSSAAVIITHLDLGTFLYRERQLWALPGQFGFLGRHMEANRLLWFRRCSW